MLKLLDEKSFIPKSCFVADPSKMSEKHLRSCVFLGLAFSNTFCFENLHGWNSADIILSHDIVGKKKIIN